MNKITKIFIIALFSFTCSTSFSQGIRFEKDVTYTQLLDKASKEGKMIMLDFYTDWCVPCKQMEERVLSQKRVGKAVNSDFISMRIDAQKGEGIDLAKQFNVTGYPTIIFLTPAGKEINRLRGAPLNINFFIEIISVIKGESEDINVILKSYQDATGKEKLKFAQKLILIGPAHYTLMKGSEHYDWRNTIKEVSDYYFANKKVKDMINLEDFEIISMHLKGGNNHLKPVSFLYENYGKFKKIVPEIDLATFVVVTNNESIQQASRNGDLIWKKYVNNIDKDLIDAYALLGEKDAKKSMLYVAEINSALYVEKNLDRYIKLRDKYSDLVSSNGTLPKGNYLYAAQLLKSHSKGKLDRYQILKAITWIDKNIETKFNLPASYMLKGDFYSLIEGEEARSIANYNLAVIQSEKQGVHVKNYYTNRAKAKIAKIKQR